MFEQEEDAWWVPRGNSKIAPTEYKRSIPLEWNRSVEAISDSTVRFVADPTGFTHQVLSSEPLGHPRVSLHQNHYAAPATPGISLGSIDFSARDQLAVRVAAYVDDQWSPSSHPAGLEFKVTQPGTLTPRYSALTIRADGRVAVGGGATSFGNSLVSLGVYRRGIFELPSVEKYEDLLQRSVGPSREAFVNGAIVYAKDLDSVLISMGGAWHSINTTPVVAKTGVKSWRQIGEPRKDGLPASFGPRGGR